MCLSTGKWIKHMCKIYIYHKIGGNIAICKKMNKYLNIGEMVKRYRFNRDETKTAAACPALTCTVSKVNKIEPIGERNSLCSCKELGNTGINIVTLSFNSVISTIKGCNQTISKDLIAHSSKTL